MSSNFTITRICQHCGTEFQARTTVTRFCSHACNSRFYKVEAKQKKIQLSTLQTAAKRAEQKMQLINKEMLNVKEVAQFIGTTTRTIHYMIKSGRLKAYNFGIRMTRVLRSELIKLVESFEDIVPIEPKPRLEREDRLTRKNCYSVDEIRKTHGMSREAIYDLVKKKKIPKLRDGRHIYLLKTAVDAVFLHKYSLTDPEYISSSVKNYYSVKEVTEKYSMNRDNIYCLLQRNNIRRVKEGRNVYLLKSDVDEYFQNVRKISPNS